MSPDVLRLLDQRTDGYRLFEISSLDDLGLDALLPMLDRAWRLDYAGEARLDFDRAVLRKMMRDPWWVGVLAVDSDGRPAGFELALERTLYVGERTFDAWYASVFTVAADHRRRGLGRWILEGINRLVFEDRGGDVIVSTFHEGHAGSPTVQSTFDRIEDWGVARFHRSPIWTRRLDRQPLPPLDPAPAFVELTQVGAGLEPCLAGRPVLDAGGLSTQTLDAGAVDALVRSSFSASFALTESLGAQYLNPIDATSGLLRYEDAPAGACLCAWNILPMAIEAHRLRPVGQLQLVLAPGASDEPIRRMVHHLGLFFAERGCFVMTALELGPVPRAVLEELGFAATEALITFAARGPKRNLEAFEGLRPPFFLDFT
jgi:GNAT superfamily N-acetyltransferase